MPGWRNFDLAHELFHILTWDAMPPEHVEDASDMGGNRVEHGELDALARATAAQEGSLNVRGDNGRALTRGISKSVSMAVPECWVGVPERYGCPKVVPWLSRSRSTMGVPKPYECPQEDDCP